jgi:hypothetical protein
MKHLFNEISLSNIVTNDGDDVIKGVFRSLIIPHNFPDFK